ncbi:hypothetical protein [Neisseria iguanae]|uniref:hypothetical protein n=1 Tax=Neisseria iguanae TaxID=90242 RepID=UPI00147478D4|nr:hypothetical protein [Neisseria iguanae]
MQRTRNPCRASIAAQGLSFDDLIKHYPNPEQAFNKFIMPHQFPLEMAKQDC